MEIVRSHSYVRKEKGRATQEPSACEPTSPPPPPLPEIKIFSADIMERIEPSVLTGTLMRHDQKHNIELLGEVYHLVHGGALSNISEDHFSNLTQTRTPALGNSMLHIAALYRSNEVVDLVVKRAPNLLFSRNSNGDTALHVAARAGHISTVQKLLEAYTDFKRPEIAKEWATFMRLHVSSETDHESGSDDEEIYVKGLIEFMRFKNAQGNTMLHEAVRSRRGFNIFPILDLEPYLAQDDIGESLLSRFALNITNKANQSVLYLAIEAGNKDTAFQILDMYCLPHVTPEGISPLVAAIMKQYPDVISFILHKSPEWIHLKDRHGRLPLHYAASTSYHEGVVQLLKRCKSCCNVKDEYGYFPLHLASHGGNVEVVKELLNYCPAPLMMFDKYDNNILHIAARSGKYEVALYILLNPELEGMINQKNKDGNTPLHLATKWCHPKIVHAFTWNRKVDLNLVNYHQQTALDIVNTIYQFQKEKPSLRQRLTWTALKAAGANPCPREVFTTVEFSASNYSNPIVKVEVGKESLSNTEPYKDMVDTLQVVSALIATASVAACLTVPGEAEGQAKNLRHVQLFCFQHHNIFVQFHKCYNRPLLDTTGIS